MGKRHIRQNLYVQKHTYNILMLKNMLSNSREVEQTKTNISKLFLSLRHKETNIT